MLDNSVNSFGLHTGVNQSAGRVREGGALLSSASDTTDRKMASRPPHLPAPYATLITCPFCHSVKGEGVEGPYVPLGGTQSARDSEQAALWKSAAGECEHVCVC